jgi:thioredoxin 1
MSGHVRDLSILDFDSTLESADKMVVVEFYLTTCPHCQAVAPIYEQVAEEMVDEALFFRIDVDQNPLLTKRFNVAGTPTFKFFCQVRSVGESVGFQNVTALRNTIGDMMLRRKDCISKSSPLRYDVDMYG